MKYAKLLFQKNRKAFPLIIPVWDNTPRSGVRGLVFRDSTPELFRIHLRDAIEYTSSNKPEERIIFVKSWNEWAEGNFLEPDRQYGTKYLEVIRNEVLCDRSTLAR